jgi:hypothetical protein
MKLIGLLRTLEQITRPPRLGHDLDVEDGAAQLAEREAETECLVPEDFNAVCRCVACVAEERAAEDELAAEEEVAEPRQCQTHPNTGWELRTPGSATPHKVCNMCDSPIPDTDFNYCDYHRGGVFADTLDPTEPGLTPDELVGVRGLLQERYEPKFGGAYTYTYPVETGHDMGLSAASELFPQHTKSAPADLLTAGSSGPEVSDVPRSPSGPHLSSSDLLDAARYVREWSKSDNCNDDPDNIADLCGLALRLEAAAE